jgi:alginate O-acetyltransferase complex protein AlgI
MIEFWRRWHITLSQWFRDYLYIPLGGGRVRWWAFNLAVVFVVSGIWHGAGWNFVLWGAIHGLALIVNRWYTAKWTLPALPAWGLTMLVSFCAWLGFYETRTPMLLLKMKAMFMPGAYNLAQWHEFATQYLSSSGLVLCCFLMLAAVILLFEWLSVARHDTPYYYLRQPAVIVALIVLTVLLAPEKSNGFIYFAF